MITKLESIDELEALVKGDTILARMPDGFDGQVTFVGNLLQYGPSFIRVMKNQIRSYSGLVPERVENGKVIFSDSEIEPHDYDMNVYRELNREITA